MCTLILVTGLPCMLPSSFHYFPQDLGRVLELTNKNHTQEVRSLHFRQRGLMREVQSLQEEGNNVKLLLKVGGNGRWSSQ